MAKETRKTKQIEADKFDRELFSLMSRADRFCDNFKSPEWKKAAESISHARYFVRKKMHYDDVKKTA